MRIVALSLWISFLVSACAGCSHWGFSKNKYQTIIADPNRDETTAREKTAQAAKAYNRNHLERAEALLQEALIADMEYGPAHNDLGLVYFRQGKYYLAAWEFEYARKALPGRAEPCNNLGLVMELVDRKELAIEHYQEACDLEGTNPEFLANLARVLLARDEHDPYAKEVLSELIIHETRPDWIAWAREKLVTGKFSANSADTTDEQKTTSNTSTPIPEEVKPSPPIEMISPLPITPPANLEEELPPPSMDTVFPEPDPQNTESLPAPK